MQIEHINLDLISKIKSGDKEAYKILFDALYDELVFFASRYIQDKDISEEIVQEYFVQFWINKKKVEITTSPKSYFYKSIRNRALNYLRDKKPNLSFDQDLSLMNETTTNINADDGDFDLLKTKIDFAINSLPEKCRKIFTLSREQKLSYKKIADELDISHKTVEAQMGIALKKLRESLKPVIKNLISLIILIKFFKNF